jgi:hypothetical protein
VNTLYAVLPAPAKPSTGNKHLGLYIAALRAFKEIGRTRAWIWLDTRDCLANILTKLMPNGEVMQAGFSLILKIRLASATSIQMEWLH